MSTNIQLAEELLSELIEQVFPDNGPFAGMIDASSMLEGRESFLWHVDESEDSVTTTRPSLPMATDQNNYTKIRCFRETLYQKPKLLLEEDINDAPFAMVETSLRRRVNKFRVGMYKRILLNIYGNAQVINDPATPGGTATALPQTQFIERANATTEFDYNITLEARKKIGNAYEEAVNVPIFGIMTLSQFEDMKKDDKVVVRDGFRDSFYSTGESGTAVINGIQHFIVADSLVPVYELAGSDYSIQPLGTVADPANDIYDAIHYYHADAALFGQDQPSNFQNLRDALFYGNVDSRYGHFTGSRTEPDAKGLVVAINKPAAA